MKMPSLKRGGGTHSAKSPAQPAQSGPLRSSHDRSAGGNSSMATYGPVVFVLLIVAGFIAWRLLQ